MTYILPHEGRRSLLRATFSSEPENITLKLYSNDYDPALNSTSGDFIEVVGGGYLSQGLLRSKWEAPATVIDDSTIIYSEPVTFTFSNTVRIVGYYVVGATSGELWWAERLYAGEGRLLLSGDQLRLIPKFELA